MTATPQGRVPKFRHWLLHIRKTLRLLGALMHDPLVPGFRKFLFVAAMVVFGGLLLIPDSIIVAALAALLPVVGPLFGIPAGLVDIAALSAFTYTLLNFFPRAIVDEHAHELWGPNPDIRPHTKAA